MNITYFKQKVLRLTYVIIKLTFEMPIKYIGKTLDYQGKTLWEIVGNLKNFGVGRMVVRSTFEKYPEPSYMKIVKVETLPNPETNTPDVRSYLNVLI